MMTELLINEPAPFLPFALTEDELRAITVDGIANDTDEVPFTRNVGNHLYQIYQWFGRDEKGTYCWFECINYIESA